MTKTLEKALAQVAKLPPKGQNAIASLILQEIESDRRWDELFAKSSSTLEKLAEKAIEDHRTGRTRPLKSVLKRR